MTHGFLFYSVSYKLLLSLFLFKFSQIEPEGEPSSWIHCPIIFFLSTSLYSGTRKCYLPYHSLKISYFSKETWVLLSVAWYLEGKIWVLGVLITIGV